MSGFVLACLALASIAASIVIWMRMIQRVELGARRWVVNTMIAGAILLGVAAFVKGPGLLGGILAGTTILVGGVYLFLLAMAGQSKQAPAVAVGSPLPGFTAPDENGQPFELGSLGGRPVLLKFFRGHW